MRTLSDALQHLQPIRFARETLGSIDLQTENNNNDLGSGAPNPDKLSFEQGQLLIKNALASHGLNDDSVFKFRTSLCVHDCIDALDGHGNWHTGEVVRITNTHVFVQWYDKSVPPLSIGLFKGGLRIAPPFTYSQSQTYTAPISPLSVIKNVHDMDFTITEKAILYAPTPPFVDSNSGSMIHKIMPKDNSCLFHSIAYTCDGRCVKSGRNAMKQRLRAHALVRSNSLIFTEAVLDSPVGKYLETLLLPHTWGSAIELQVFASLYQCEIFAFDYSQPTVYRFGIGRSFSKRVFLVYSGNHYDVLVWKKHDNSELEYFNSNDYKILFHAKEIVEKLYLNSLERGNNYVLPESDTINWPGQGLYELNKFVETGRRGIIVSPTKLHPEITIDTTIPSPRHLPLVSTPLHSSLATLLQRDRPFPTRRTRRTMTALSDIVPFEVLQSIAPYMDQQSQSPSFHSPTFSKGRNSDSFATTTTQSSSDTAKFSQSPSLRSSSLKEGEYWVCNNCTLRNSLKRSKCRLCNN